MSTAADQPEPTKRPTSDRPLRLVFEARLDPYEDAEGGEDLELQRELYDRLVGVLTRYALVSVTQLRLSPVILADVPTVGPSRLVDEGEAFVSGEEP